MKPLFWLFSTATLFSTTILHSQGTDSFALVQGSKIYYSKKGNATQAIVFVSGLGEDHNTWSDVQDSIATFATTISYDRAGLGKSAYHGEKKDVRSLVTELQALLHSIHVSQPYVLVGHSLGCQIVKEYAALFPTTVA